MFTFLLHIRGLSGPAEWGTYELKGILDAPKISFIMCSHPSEEVGARHSFYIPHINKYIFSVHLLAIDCLSFNLTRFNPLLLFRTSESTLDSIFLLPQIRSAASGDSKDVSVATKQGGYFHCHFRVALFHCTSRSECGNPARRGVHFRRQLDGFCRELVCLPRSINYSDLKLFC